MKIFITVIISFLFLQSVCLGQTSTRTKSGSLFPEKEVKLPEASIDAAVYDVPFLTAEINFSEPSGNGILDANEEGLLLIKIFNNGNMIARNCELHFSSDIYQSNIISDFQSLLGNIEPAQIKELNIKLTANELIPTGKTIYSLKILEESGFDMDPSKTITINTREFQPPGNEIVDWGIEDQQNRNQKIEKFETVDVTFRIQNKGETTSLETYAVIELGENVIAMDVAEKYMIGELKSGEYQDIVAKIATNARATEVKMSVSIHEASGNYTKYQSFDLPFDVVQKSSDEIMFATKVTEELDIRDVANLKLDIAENIPESSYDREYAIAVIIGNKNYESIFDVDYAINDAAIMKNYVSSALGYKSENILYYQNATQSDFNNIFGKSDNYKGKLFDWAVKGRSEVFIYYSGHGAPHPDNQQGYIIPADCDPGNVSLNGYSLKTLYSNLDKIANEKQLVHVTVVMDACFSGNSQGGNLLKNISPVYMKVKDYTMVYPNSSVFTSASGDEVSTWYTDKKQSLFTYFFLKGLQGAADYNNDNTITTKELYEFTADEINGVPYWARRLNGNSQTPTFVGSEEYKIYE